MFKEYLDLHISAIMNAKLIQILRLEPSLQGPYVIVDRCAGKLLTERYFARYDFIFFLYSSSDNLSTSKSAFST